VTPQDKNLPAEEYLVGLIKAMIGEDQDLVGLNNARTNIGASECMRNLPSISSAYTNTKAVALKAELAQHLCVLVTPKDDPVYLQLHDKYQGCILFDNETRASQKLFRVVAIQYVQSFAAGRFSCWEATCEPIYRDAGTGKFVVPPELLVEGSSVIHTNALVGYAVAEYPNGSDGQPTFLPWLDNYIYHFENVIAPKFATTPSTLDSPSKGRKDLPSYTQLPHKPTRPKSSSRT
jgi:hypothetical protein